MSLYKRLPKKRDGEENEYVIRISDGSFIHTTLNQQYLKWLSEGNTPLPADSESVI